MKKFIAMLLAMAMVLAFAGCAGSAAPETTPATEAPATEAPVVETEAPVVETEAAVQVMTHEEFMAAELESIVTVETYVQATQSWWDNKITVYCQGEDGAYFLYELACSEEDAAKLVPGTKIRVTGDKGEWAGEVEIMNGTFEFVEGESFIAEATDVTELLGTEELIAHQNEFVSFTGLTIEAINYKNGEPGDDIYVTASKDGANYEFCVERYLTGPDTEVYKAFETLKVGDVVDIEGFLYYYANAINPHVISIKPAA